MSLTDLATAPAAVPALRREPPPARLVRWWLMAAGVGAAVLFLELGFRWWHPQSEFAVTYAPWGYQHQRNASITFYLEQPALGNRGSAIPPHPVPVHYNSQGLRDYEYPYAKPPGTVRILLIGDSWAEDLGSYLENLHVKHLERKLNALGSETRFEVLNGGHYAFDNAQELMWFLHEGRKYEPDVVLALYAHDAADAQYATVEHGELRLHEMVFTPAQRLYRTVVSWVRARSHLGNFVLNKVYQIQQLQGWLAARRFKESPVAVPDVRPAVAGDADVHGAGAADKPFAQVDELIWLRFRDEAAAQGGRFAFVSAAPLDASQQRFLTESSIPSMTVQIPFNPDQRRAEDLRAGRYDPRQDSHRFGYKANEVVADQVLGFLVRRGLLSVPTQETP